MCSYRTLRSSIHGYVVQCNTCSYIQVGFGTTVISFTVEQFHDFAAVAENEYRQCPREIPMDQKNIRIPTAAKSVAMVFTPRELHLLLDLLRAGQDRLVYNELLNLCEN